jgi:putative transcriptional regulator
MSDLAVGQLLVADPVLDETVFAGSVLLVLQHHAQGIVAVNLTHTPRQLTEKFREFGLGFILASQPEDRQHFYMGGLVPDPDQIFYIHDKATGPVDSIPLGDTGFAWTALRFSDPDLIAPFDFWDKQPETVIAVINYNGWVPGKLEEQIAHDFWRTPTISLADLLALKPDERWQAAIDSVKPDFSKGSPDFGGPIGGPGWMPS